MKVPKTALPIIGSTLLAGATIAAVFFSSSIVALLSILIITAFAAVFQHLQLSAWSKEQEVEKNKARTLLQRTVSKSAVSKLDENADMIALLAEIDKAVAEALRKERAAAENAVDVICVIDTNGNILSANSAAQTAWGYSQEELIDQSITKFILAETPEGTLNPFLGAEMSIDKVIVENRLKKKNGEIIDLLWSAHWSASDSGLFCIAHDITERKRSEKILEESEKRVRLILESIPAGIAIINKMGNFEFMNKTSCELTDYGQDSITKLRASELFSFARDPFLPSKFIEAATDETQVVTRSGEHIPCSLSVKELVWNHSPAVLVIFIDLRDRYAIEQTKREFLAMVSHDLRGPLTSINSVLALIDEGHLGELSDGGKRLTGKTLKQSLRLVQMINELLDMEKMRSGRFVSHLAEASILSLAKDAIEVVERTASSQGIMIILEGNDCECVCDGARIIQVLVNLLDNALKFTESGAQIKIGISKEAESGCIVSICNYGRLIPEEKLSTIFDKFVQAKPGSAQERKGTGLGLAICKSIIEQHGERIWAESSAAEGTRFRFTLGTAELKAAFEDDNKQKLLTQG